MKLGIFIIITLVSFFAVLGPWLAAGRMPLPADSRAHIFRIEYFYDGMANGDYVPSQYHGYSFLAGYGTLEYAVGYALFRFFMFGFPAIPSSVYAFDALMVFALALWRLPPPS